MRSTDTEAELLRVYKTNQPVTNLEQIPIDNSERIATDIFCTILTAIWAIAMLTIAIVVLDLAKLQKMTYPTDQQGRHCTLDNLNYNYLYFTSPNDLTKRLCVASCPVSSNQKKLDCWPTKQLSCTPNSNPEFQVVIYPSRPTQTSMGLFCEAEDQTLNKKLYDQAGLSEMFHFATAYGSVGIGMCVALGLGLLAVGLLTWIPVVMGFVGVILGGLGCIAIGVYVLISNNQILTLYKTIGIIFAIVMLFIGALLIFAALFRKKDVNVSIIFIKKAGECFWDRPSLIFLSFLFILLLVGLIVLCGFQTLAYWSNSDMSLSSESIYYRPSGTFAITMTILNSIQFIWGLCFLKQAFNFIISGSAASWFFQQQHAVCQSFGALIKYHWGSVVGGAFLLNVLYPFDLIYDLLKPPQESGGCYRSMCCCCERVLDLSRSESMTIIHLVGIPYCNAARWCEKVQYHSKMTQGNESANRFVRIGSHVLLASISTAVTAVYMSHHDGVSVIALIITFVLSLFILTFFVCLIKDIAECLFMCEMVEEYYQIVIGIRKSRDNLGYDILPTNP